MDIAFLQLGYLRSPMIDFTYICADLETNGLSPNKIFMIGVQDLMTGQYHSFVGMDQVAEAIFAMSEKSKVIVGHNFRGFDAKTIRNLTGVTINEYAIVDSLDMSKDMVRLGSHGLATWGSILGFPKLAQPLFEEYTPEMDTYCERDVRLNSAVFGFLFNVYRYSPPPKMRSYSAVLAKHKDALAKAFLFA